MISKHIKLQFNKLEEIRNNDYENARIYKEKMMVFYDKTILQKSFTSNQKVLLYNFKFHFLLRKLNQDG